ncbi:dihydrodipicolinate synthase family protein [Geminicoccus harenae]|uniref:dihydrodipicolinate synthase family protein n=1 Tax=Geminicoccus harenae TaxID=2498453 RepID=UPI00168B8EC5|nr:dihydrodipicolinate synthase family protein [Geminicoccus harenae]
MQAVLLPGADRRVETYTPGKACPYPAKSAVPRNRVAYAAAHVVADPLAEAVPFEGGKVDWGATLRFRHHLWGLGFKVAEAMDTSQRGMGLAWPDAAALIRRSVAEAKTVPGADLACGVGTDQLPPRPGVTLDEVRRAYLEQLEVVEKAGGRAILMASRALVLAAKGPDDYRRLYGELIGQARDKVVLHWLGPMFDPQLEGYWGSHDLDEAQATLLGLIRDHAGRIDGVKMSLLDKERELGFRRSLPEGVKCFTGDDFNYAELIEGDGARHSDALLGIFDPIARAAAAALAALDEGRVEDYRAILRPTVPLSRKIFEAPTRFYKSGVVLLAWLNGHQDHFAMLGGQQAARSALHYAEVFRLADQAGVLDDPELASRRMARLMATFGIE